MWLLFVAAAIPSFQLPEKRIEFGRCPATAAGMHIQIKEFGDQSYMVHYHLVVKNMKNKTIFTRIRCGDNEGSAVHSCMKEIKIREDVEQWAFFMVVPKFKEQEPPIIYQIEVGEMDLEEVDTHIVSGAFGWHMKDGKMTTGTKKDKAQMTVTRREVVQIKEQNQVKFKVATVQKTIEIDAESLKYGVSKFESPASGQETAFRNYP